jgi:hypothetical protein
VPRPGPCPRRPGRFRSGRTELDCRSKANRETSRMADRDQRGRMRERGGGLEALMVPGSGESQTESSGSAPPSGGGYFRVRRRFSDLTLPLRCPRGRFCFRGNYQVKEKPRLSGASHKPGTRLELVTPSLPWKWSIREATRADSRKPAREAESGLPPSPIVLVHQDADTGRSGRFRGDSGHESRGHDQFKCMPRCPRLSRFVRFRLYSGAQI